MGPATNPRKRVASTDKESSKATKSQKVTAAENVEEPTNRNQAASTEKESFKATKLHRVTAAENVEEPTNRKQAASTEKESFKAKKSLKAATAESVEEPTNRKQAASTEKESSKAKKSLKAAMAENVEEPTITCRSSDVVVGGVPYSCTTAKTTGRKKNAAEMLLDSDNEEESRCTYRCRLGTPLIIVQC